MIRQVNRLVAICCAFSVLVVSQITRLPDCMYHGDFKIHDGKRFQGTVAETHSDVTNEQCLRKCFANNDCLFINHKKDNSKCELFTSNIGTLADDDEWAHLSPDYSDPLKVGPSCVPNFPCDDPSHLCITVCEDPGYKCVNTNVATTSKATATQSSDFDASYIASKAIDGDYNTFSSTKMPTAYVVMWWKVELDKIYRIVSVYVELAYQIPSDSSLQVSTDDVTFEECAVLSEDSMIFPCVKQGKFVSVYHPSMNDVLQIRTFKVFADVKEFI